MDMGIQWSWIGRIHVEYLKKVEPLLLSWDNALLAEEPLCLGPQTETVGLMLTVHHERKSSLSRDH
jgi:hypothetical protein